MWSMAPAQSLSLSLSRTHRQKKWKSNRLEFRSAKILTFPWGNLLSISIKKQGNRFHPCYWGNPGAISLPICFSPIPFFFFKAEIPHLFPSREIFFLPLILHSSLQNYISCCHFTQGKHLNLRISILAEVAIWAWAWYPYQCRNLMSTNKKATAKL